VSQPETPRSGGWLLPVVLVVAALASMILVGGGLLVLWGDKSTIFDHPLLRPPPSPSTASPVPTVAPPPAPTTNSGPHPMYPTPDEAGTTDLFEAGDVDRGPHVDPHERVPATVPRPSHHAHCEMEVGGVVCSPALGSAPEVGWMVGDKGGRSFAQEVRFGRVQQTLVTERSGSRVERVLSFDGHRQVKWVRSFAKDGEVYTARRRTGANELDGCGRRRVRWDAHGRAAKTWCLQWNGKPMKDERGVAATAFKRDARGFVVEERYFDDGGEPVAGHDSVHRIEIPRDAAGRRMAVKHFGVAGKPVRSRESGCHELRWELDDHGLRKERRCLGVDGDVSTDRAEVAIIRYGLDEQGCEVGERYLDAQHNAVTDYEGVHALVRRVTPLCETVEKRCLDVGGGLAACGPGEPAMYRYRLDKWGQVEAVSHHGLDAGPGRDPEFGVYELRYVLDETGLRIEIACFDGTRSATPCGTTGFHGRAIRYDEAAREVEARFFDNAHTPCTNRGTFVRTLAYDAYDHLIETKNLDKHGRVIESMGNATNRYLYDDGHRLFGILLYDAQGKPAIYSGCFTGLTCPSRPWHAVRVVRSDKGRVTKNLFFDRSRALVHTNDCGVAQCWK